MRAELSRLGVEFERIPGVDGTALSSQVVAEFRYLRPLSGGDPRRVWTVGHIGCFLSHVAVWRRIASGSDPIAAVFEDDVHLSALLGRFLQDFGWVPGDADIVRFETTGHGMRLGKAAARHEGIAVRPASFNAWGTAGYAIRRDVAAWLISAPPRYHAPIDYFLFHTPTSPVARVLRVYQTDPALCVQDSHHPASPNALLFESATNPMAAENVTLVRRVYLLARPAARLALRRRAVPFQG